MHLLLTSCVPGCAQWVLPFLERPHPGPAVQVVVLVVARLAVPQRTVQDGVPQLAAGDQLDVGVKLGPQVLLEFLFQDLPHGLALPHKVARVEPLVGQSDAHLVGRTLAQTALGQLHPERLDQQGLVVAPGAGQYGVIAPLLALEQLLLVQLHDNVQERLGRQSLLSVQPGKPVSKPLDGVVRLGAAHDLADQDGPRGAVVARHVLDPLLKLVGVVESVAVDAGDGDTGVARHGGRHAQHGVQPVRELAVGARLGHLVARGGGRAGLGWRHCGRASWGCGLAHKYNCRKCTSWTWWWAMAMAEFEVADSAMLCQLLVRGWTIDPQGHTITKQKLTSSSSVVLECRDAGGDAYTVTISDNKTYVSQDGQPTVTAQFVCLPGEYTDNYDTLRNSVIIVQRLSVGGGSTSGPVTLEADAFDDAVKEFKGELTRLPGVIQSAIEATTPAVAQAAVASAESAPASSIAENNAVVAVLNQVVSKLDALQVQQATIQGAGNASNQKILERVISLYSDIDGLFSAMDERNQQLLSSFTEQNNSLIQEVLAATDLRPRNSFGSVPRSRSESQEPLSGESQFVNLGANPSDLFSSLVPTHSVESRRHVDAKIEAVLKEVHEKLPRIGIATNYSIEDLTNKDTLKKLCVDIHNAYAHNIAKENVMGKLVELHRDLVLQQGDTLELFRQMETYLAYLKAASFIVSKVDFTMAGDTNHTYVCVLLISRQNPILNKKQKYVYDQLIDRDVQRIYVLDVDKAPELQGKTTRPVATATEVYTAYVVQKFKDVYFSEQKTIDCPYVFICPPARDGSFDARTETTNALIMRHIASGHMKKVGNYKTIREHIKQGSFDTIFKLAQKPNPNPRPVANKGSKNADASFSERQNFTAEAERLSGNTVSNALKLRAANSSATGAASNATEKKVNARAALTQLLKSQQSESVQGSDSDKDKDSVLDTGADAESHVGDLELELDPKPKPAPDTVINSSNTSLPAPPASATPAGDPPGAAASSISSALDVSDARLKALRKLKEETAQSIDLDNDKDSSSDAGSDAEAHVDDRKLKPSLSPKPARLSPAPPAFNRLGDASSISSALDVSYAQLSRYRRLKAQRKLKEEEAKQAAIKYAAAFKQKRLEFYTLTKHESRQLNESTREFSCQVVAKRLNKEKHTITFEYYPEQPIMSNDKYNKILLQGKLKDIVAFSSVSLNYEEKKVNAILELDDRVIFIQKAVLDIKEDSVPEVPEQLIHYVTRIANKIIYHYDRAFGRYARPAVAPAPTGNPLGAAASSDPPSVATAPTQGSSGAPNFQLYVDATQQPFLPMLKNCSEYEQFLIIDRLRLYYKVSDVHPRGSGEESQKEALESSVRYAMWFCATICNDTADVQKFWDMYVNYGKNSLEDIGIVYTEVIGRIISEYMAVAENKENALVFEKQIETLPREATQFLQRAMKKIRQNILDSQMKLAQSIGENDHLLYNLDGKARLAIESLREICKTQSATDNEKLMQQCNILFEEIKSMQYNEEKQYIISWYTYALLCYVYDDPVLK